MPTRKEIAFQIMKSIFRESPRISKVRFREQLIENLKQHKLAHKDRTVDSYISQFHHENGQLIDGFNNQNELYYTVDPEWLNENQDINMDDLAALVQISSFLKQYKQLGFYKEIQEVINKIQSKSMLTLNTSFDDIIIMSNNVAIQGIEYFDDILKAIISKTPIEIQHKPFYPSQLNKKSFDEFLVHPYALKEYNNRWYIFGYTETGNRGLGTYAIDRLQSPVQPRKDRPFIPYTGTSPGEYFKKTPSASVCFTMPLHLRKQRWRKTCGFGSRIPYYLIYVPKKSIPNRKNWVKQPYRANRGV